jgi:hypothetical protein
LRDVPARRWVASSSSECEASIQKSVRHIDRHLKHFQG